MALSVVNMVKEGKKIGAGLRIEKVWSVAFSPLQIYQQCVILGVIILTGIG